jgi:hypothetical protein
MPKLPLIPLSKEDGASFQRRLSYCLEAKNHLQTFFPGQLQDITDDASGKMALQQLAERYCLSPSWVPLVFSNAQLPLWCGGAAWIIQMDENSPVTALLQLRTRLKQKTKLLFYKKEEIVAHELFHASRSAFDEPKFEEILAYRLSSNRCRAYFGPLFQSPKETLFLVIYLLLLCAAATYTAIFLSPIAYAVMGYLQLGLILFLAILISRLAIRQKQLNRALANMPPHELPAEAIAARLTDREIIAFSMMNSAAIADYLKAAEELRFVMDGANDMEK